jgi:lysophospholipase L1-like esterase
LIWASTTDGRRRNRREEADPKTDRIMGRNRDAAAVVRKQNIPIDDLLLVVQGHPEYHTADGVHFTEKGYAVLAAPVAVTIGNVLLGIRNGLDR